MDSIDFYKRIQAYGSRRGLKIEDAEDLASYSLIYFLGGRKASFQQYYIDFLRKNLGNKRSPSFEQQRNIKSPAKHFDDKIPQVQRDLDLDMDIRKALKNLSSKQRYLIYLKHHCGYTGREIADILGVSPKTIWDRLKIIYVKIERIL